MPRRSRKRKTRRRYYEFQAIERALGGAQLERLERMPGGDLVDSTTFLADYAGDDLPLDPLELLEQMFDGFVCVTNDGERRLVLKTPRDAVDVEPARAYCRPGGSVSVRESGPWAIFELWSPRIVGEGELEEGEAWMDDLGSLRSDLLAGDYRGLYLGWLRDVELGAPEEDREPPVPAGLFEPNDALRAVQQFLEVNPLLIAVAADASAPMEEPVVTRDEVGAWIDALSAEEKNDLLRRAAFGELPGLEQELLRRYRGRHWRAPAPDAGQPRRTAGDVVRGLVAAVKQLEREHDLFSRRPPLFDFETDDDFDFDFDLDFEADREAWLERIIEHEDEYWDAIGALIDGRTPAYYRRAAESLVDMREALTRVGRAEDFRAAMQSIRAENARKARFLQELTRAGLDEATDGGRIPS